jgi:hypothetical protein
MFNSRKSRTLGYNELGGIGHAYENNGFGKERIGLIDKIL